MQMYCTFIYVHSGNNTLFVSTSKQKKKAKKNEIQILHKTALQFLFIFFFMHDIRVPVFAYSCG